MAGSSPSLHQAGELLTSGESLTSARAAMIMLHGRGATAEDILGLASEFEASGMAFVAPQAANNTWYPNSFLSPIATNEPWLSSALGRVDDIVTQLVASGVRPEQIFLLGFSQGACVALEYVARNPRRYAGVVGLSGGLIGPPGGLREYPGSMDGTPVFLGCSDVDFHIPKGRVEESGEIFRGLGAKVTVRLYRNMGHTVNQDEIDWVRNLLA